MGNYSVTANEYKSLSKSYDSRFQSYIHGVTEKILAAAKLPSGSTILDLGCGTGEILLALAKANPNAKEFVGIDLSEDMLRLAKTKLSGF